MGVKGSRILKSNNGFEIRRNRLISINFQVQFLVFLRQKKTFHRSILVVAACSLREVVLAKSNNLGFMKNQKEFKHRNHYFTGKFSELDLNFIII